MEALWKRSTGTASQNRRGLCLMCTRHVYVCFLTSKPGPSVSPHCSPGRERKPPPCTTVLRGIYCLQHTARQPPQPSGQLRADLLGREEAAASPCQRAAPAPPPFPTVSTQLFSTPFGEEQALFPAPQVGYLPLTSIPALSSLPFRFFTLF